MSFALDRPRRLDLETFGRAVDLHPDLVRRLVTLGLLDAATDTAGRMWFRPREVAAAFRIQRLRSNLSLNYAAIGVVVDLLDRITVLEAELRSRPRQIGDHQWT
jgi:hypothetical protein